MRIQRKARARAVTRRPHCDVTALRRVGDREMNLTVSGSGVLRGVLHDVLPFSFGSPSPTYKVPALGL